MLNIKFYKNSECIITTLNIKDKWKDDIALTGDESIELMHKLNKHFKYEINPKRKPSEYKFNLQSKK